MHIPMHIPTPNVITSSVQPPVLPTAAALNPPSSYLPLSAAEWSLLINKVQAGELPPIMIAPMANALMTTPPGPLSKVFTTETATFTLDSEPGELPNCLFQMVLNKVFIPLSMLTTVSLSRIHYNDNLKFKKIPFGYVARKYALDQAHFPSEDSLTNTEYMQAHKHWLTLINILVEPTV